MSIEHRGQGRPARGNGEVGRARLLEKTREALKAKPKINLQRRELALVAGVTPALVSYYYPEKWDLLAAAAKPVIEIYTRDMQAILRSNKDPLSKIWAIAYLFTSFNLNQGYLLDFYLENSERMARQDDLKALKDVYAEMLDFFARLLQQNLIRGESATFIQSSLWGLCKCIAQQPDLINLVDLPEKDRVLRLRVEMVCDLFLNGVAAPQLYSSYS